MRPRPRVGERAERPRSVSEKPGRFDYCSKGRSSGRLFFVHHRDTEDTEKMFVGVLYMSRFGFAVWVGMNLL